MKNRLTILMTMVTLISWSALAGINPNVIEVDLDIEGVDDTPSASGVEAEVSPGGFVAVDGSATIILKVESPNWAGPGKLTWDNDSKITVLDPEGEEIEYGHEFPAYQLSDGVYLEVVGKEASDDLADVHMMLEALHCAPGMRDIVAFTVVQMDLTAKDLSTYPTGNERKAAAGQTLYLVAEEEFETQKASITAAPIGGVPFGSGEPIWEGQTAGNNGDATVEYSGGSGDEETVSAKAWVGPYWECSKDVGIAIVGKNEESFNLVPGANTLKPILDALSATKAFPGASLTAEAKFDVGGAMWTVEKPNSPLTTKSYSGNLDLGGKLTGKIWAPPPLSGEFPPGWMPGEPWMLWQVYASASIGLTAEGKAKWLNEYNPSKGEFDGSAGVSGDVEAGVYAVIQAPYFTLDGAVSANAGVKYNFTIEGVSPNKKLMGQWETQAVSLKGSIKCVRDSDGYIVFDFEASIDVWDGWTQNPKTLLIGQPANPGP